MNDLAFITGNQNKADYLEKWLGHPVKHEKLDLDEIQSLDLREVAEHKARQAYGIAKKPVLVEDVALTFTAMGRLPGTLIKWFLEEIGPEGLAKVADSLENRQAVASILYALYDGNDLHFFEGEVKGTIASQPQAFDKDNGWRNTKSWNSIFIPDGSAKTYAEMSDAELRLVSHRAQAIDKLRAFLDK